MSSTFTSRTGTHPEEGIKAPVVVSTDANITLSGEQTIRSVAVTAGDRVLVKDQTAPAENGIYIVAVGAWSRAPDWDDAQDVISGVTVVDNANDEVWKVEFTGDFVAGTTEQTFDSVFTPGSLADGAVTTTKIADEAVTPAKMERQTSGHLLIGQGAGSNLVWKTISGAISITSAGVVSLANSVVTTTKLAAQAVTPAKMERQTSGRLLIGQGASDMAYKDVTGDVTIDEDGVTAIGNAKVTATKMASNSVETAKIKDENVTESKLSASVQTKLNATVSSIYRLKAGLGLSNSAADSDHDIDVAPGACSDSTDSYLIQISSGATAQIDVAIGSANGGFPSGLTLSADTWYGVFLCAPTDGSEPKVCFDTSTTAANALSDCTTQFTGTYTIYRRIGWVLTDGSSNIVAFNQYGDRFVWGSLKMDADLLSCSTGSRASLSVTAPPGVVGEFSLYAIDASGTANRRRGIITSANQPDSAPTDTNYNFLAGSTGGQQREPIVNLMVKVDSSSQIFQRGDAADIKIDVFAIGWTDLFDD